jgi:hypothetical protein
MARPRKTACYDADAATIKKFFAESLGAREEQNAASGLISSINSEMEAAGVHPGVMSTMRKIKAMPDGKRGSTCSCCVATPTCSRKSCTTQSSPPRPKRSPRRLAALSLSSMRVVLWPPEQWLGVLLSGVRGELRETDAAARRCRVG